MTDCGVNVLSWRMREHDYYVYIVTNSRRTVLYTGVTNSLMRRIWQHRNGEGSAFTKRYQTNRLVLFEHFREVESAIAREKEIKGWKRCKKEALITEGNPRWEDLAVTVLELEPL